MSRQPRLRALVASVSIALVGGFGVHQDSSATPSSAPPSKPFSQIFSHSLNAHPNFSTAVASLSAQHPAAQRAPQRVVVSSLADSGTGSMRAAIENAAEGDTIDLSRMRGRIVLSSALVPSASVTIEGPGEDQLVLDGGGVDRVIASSHSLTLSNVTLTNGVATQLPAGGCIFDIGDVVLDHATITGCSVGFASGMVGNKKYNTAQGGAIFTVGSLEVKYSTITNNSAVAPSNVESYATGGAIAVYAGGPFQSPNSTALGILNSTITGNSVQATARAIGGAVSIQDSGSSSSATYNAYIVGSTITGNSATATGYYNSQSVPPTTTANVGAGGIVTYANITTSISDTVISGNSVVSAVDPATASGMLMGEAAGGGLAMISAQPNSMVSYSQITNNTVTSKSGAVYGGGAIIYGGLTTVSYSTISGNSAKTTADALAIGGGLLTPSGVLLEASTVSGNSVTSANAAKSFGGGVAAQQPNSSNMISFEMLDSTISGNSASIGAGLYAGPQGSIGVYNSTIAFNTASANGGGVAFGPTITATFGSTIVSNNVSASASTNDIFAASPTTVAGDHNLFTSFDTSITFANAPIASDPLLKPLADNGGPTLTHALDPASPAIDQGSNPQSLKYDQRGYPHDRSFGAAPDIGAYELDTDRIFHDGFEGH